MTVREAFTFFRGRAKVQARLKRLIDVGLDYLRLGQPAKSIPTLCRLRVGMRFPAARFGCLGERGTAKDRGRRRTYERSTGVARHRLHPRQHGCQRQIHFVIELTREGRMDEMTVLAEARPESWDGSGLVEHAERVTAYIKNTIGISARVRAVAPETLERSLGKARRVYDKRPKE